MLKFWSWLDGKKVYIGVIASIVASVLARRGVEVPAWVFDITDGILGLGLAHKFVKTVKPSVIAAASGVLLLFLAGCASNPQTVSAPQSDRVAQGERGNSIVLGDGWSSTSPKSLAEIPNDTLVKYGRARIVARAPDGSALLDKNGNPIFDEYNGVRSVVQNFGSISQTGGDGTAATSGNKSQDEVGKPTSTPTNTVSPPVNVSGLPGVGK